MQGKLIFTLAISTHSLYVSNLEGHWKGNINDFQSSCPRPKKSPVQTPAVHSSLHCLNFFRAVRRLRAHFYALPKIRPVQSSDEGERGGTETSETLHDLQPLIWFTLLFRSRFRFRFGFVIPSTVRGWLVLVSKATMFRSYYHREVLTTFIKQSLHAVAPDA